jgi:hypothetical protein
MLTPVEQNNMSAYDKSLLTTIFILSLAVLTLATIILDYYHERNVIMERLALESGRSPMEIACAMDDPNGDNPTCLVIAQSLRGK